MTNLDFTTRHPEFLTADPAVLTAVLADVELGVSDRWGTRRPEAVALTAAARLAVSPAGRNARLSYEAKNAAPTSTYEVRLQVLKAGLACANGRIG